MSYTGVYLRVDHSDVGTTFGSFFFVGGDEIVSAVSKSAIYMRYTSLGGCPMCSKGSALKVIFT